MRLGRALSRAGDFNLFLVGFSSCASLPVCQKSIQVKVLSLSYLFATTVSEMLGHHSGISEALLSLLLPVEDK